MGHIIENMRGLNDVSLKRRGILGVSRNKAEDDVPGYCR
jgi:hypothetical protein